MLLGTVTDMASCHILTTQFCCRSASLCDRLLVMSMYYEKTADWIKMPFGMVVGSAEGVIYIR